MKSKAVVAFTRAGQPELFRELHENFNIKLPPSNWLSGGSQWFRYVRNASLAKHHQFSRLVAHESVLLIKNIFSETPTTSNLFYCIS